MEGILIIQFLLSKIDMAPTCHTDDQFNLVFPRDSLTLPWTARRSNQSILKDINPEMSLGRLMLKLKLRPPDVKC